MRLSREGQQARTLKPTARDTGSLVGARAARAVQTVEKGRRMMMAGACGDSETGRPCQAALVLAGPSGVGKGTLVQELRKAMGDRIGFSVSHTTRPMRANEADGVSYHFTDKASMRTAIDNGEFIEHAEVHGNLYGTSKASVERVLASGRVCVLDIDVQGAESVRASNMDALLAFVEPPSLAELERRLRSRGTEAEEEVQRRLANAKGEIERSQQPGLFDLHVVNNNASSCAQEVLDALASRTRSSEHKEQ